MVNYLNVTQFKAETDKCLQCITKPCMKACPVRCSPHDFIKAAKEGELNVAANLIYSQNPMGETCGLVCPDKFCMKACVRAKIDYAIKIPAVQAYIMKKARENDSIYFDVSNIADKKVAVIGAGPSGIGATAELVKHGIKTVVFEKNDSIGGAANLIPQMRLPREVISYEWKLLEKTGLAEIKFMRNVTDYDDLLHQGFSAVIVCKGEQKPRLLNIKGENFAVSYTQYLKNPQMYKTKGNVAIVGGGAVAVDCVLTAKSLGAENVEMFVRRKIGNMRVTPQEYQSLLDADTDITTMTRIESIAEDGEFLTAYTLKTRFNHEGKLEDVPNSLIARKGFSLIILALGSSRDEDYLPAEKVFYAGDFVNGGSTVVEAIASGKNAAFEVIKMLANQ